MNIKRIGLSIMSLLLVVGTAVIPVLATTWYPNYDGQAHSNEVFGSCPVSKSSSNVNGFLEAMVYSDDMGGITAWAHVWKLWTPSATTTYDIGINYDYNYNVYIPQDNDVAKYIVKIRIERADNGNLVKQTTVRTFQPTQVAVWKRGTGTETKSTSASLTNGVQYKIIAVLNAFGEAGGMVGNSKDDMDSLQVNWISVNTGGGCPILLTWNGDEYIEDNNLLSSSEGNVEPKDVEDYYKIQQPLAQDNKNVLLQLRENQGEHDYFDTVKLIAIKHDANVGVVPTADGEFITYTNPVPPVSCITDEGVDILDTVHEPDSISYQVQAESKIYLNFGTDVQIDNAKLLLKIGCPKSPLYVQTLNINSEWQTIETVWIKFNEAFYGVKVQNWIPDIEGNYVIRLVFSELSEDNDIDYIALDTTQPADIEIIYATLIKATHSLLGQVKPQINSDDGIYVELVQGEYINLEYKTPKADGKQIDWVFYSKGYYTNNDN